MDGGVVTAPKRRGMPRGSRHSEEAKARMREAHARRRRERATASAAVPEILNEPCSCPEGWCDHGVEPSSGCINRFGGDVRVLPCAACSAHTWHQDGDCLSCRLREGPRAAEVA